jgi:hypothetical protein
MRKKCAPWSADALCFILLSKTAKAESSASIRMTDLAVLGWQKIGQQGLFCGLS